jgi:hypothetical protein
MTAMISIIVVTVLRGLFLIGSLAVSAAGKDH